MESGSLINSMPNSLFFTHSTPAILASLPQMPNTFPSQYLCIYHSFPFNINVYSLTSVRFLFEYLLFRDLCPDCLVYSSTSWYKHFRYCCVLGPYTSVWYLVCAYEIFIEWMKVACFLLLRFYNGLGEGSYTFILLVLIKNFALKQHYNWFTQKRGIHHKCRTIS